MAIVLPAKHVRRDYISYRMSAKEAHLHCGASTGFSSDVFILRISRRQRVTLGDAGVPLVTAEREASPGTSRLNYIGTVRDGGNKPPPT